MAGERILVVDDTPVSLKLTRILLINSGFIVQAAASEEQVLESLRTFGPSLMLVDARYPGLAELARAVKQNDGGVIVIALSAAGDERKAVEAGCDGSITRPVDARTLAARLREFLDHRTSASSASPVNAFSEPDVAELRDRFLAEGLEKGDRMLASLDGHFDAAQAAKTTHQWIGAGGLLGYVAISRLSREVEGLLGERPLDNAQLRESLARLVAAFRNPEEKKDTSLPESVVETLSGKRIGMIGFSSSDGWHVTNALDQVHAASVLFEVSVPPDSESLLECDVLMLHVTPETLSSPWLDPASTGCAPRPIVFVGGRDQLLSLDRAVQGRAREFLFAGWRPEEALLRLSLAFSPVPGAVPNSAPAAAPRTLAGRPEVLVADDDATVLLLVRLALQNYGMDCRLVSNGPDALEAIRKYRPHAAVLDVNMPGMNGYEVLAAVRSEDIPTRVLLLTARQQEHDVVRGFTLGADDYVVKPFSPMELVARLKRLLWR